MYNNIGLATPRGSGTSGYIQKSLAFVKPKRLDLQKNEYEAFNILDLAKSQGLNGGKDSFVGTKAERKKAVHKDIVDHNKKREIEVKLFELRETLFKEGRPNAEIEEAVHKERKRLGQLVDERGVDIFPKPKQRVFPKGNISQYRNQYSSRPFRRNERADNDPDGSSKFDSRKDAANRDALPSKREFSRNEQRQSHRNRYPDEEHRRHSVSDIESNSSSKSCNSSSSSGSSRSSSRSSSLISASSSSAFSRSLSPHKKPKTRAKNPLAEIRTSSAPEKQSRRDREKGNREHGRNEPEKNTLKRRPSDNIVKSSRRICRDDKSPDGRTIRKALLRENKDMSSYEPSAKQRRGDEEYHRDQVKKPRKRSRSLSRSPSLERRHLQTYKREKLPDRNESDRMPRRRTSRRSEPAQRPRDRRDGMRTQKQPIKRERRNSSSGSDPTQRPRYRRDGMRTQKQTVERERRRSNSNSKPREHPSNRCEDIRSQKRPVERQSQRSSSESEPTQRPRGRRDGMRTQKQTVERERRGSNSESEPTQRPSDRGKEIRTQNKPVEQPRRGARRGSEVIQSRRECDQQPERTLSRSQGREKKTVDKHEPAASRCEDDRRRRRNSSSSAEREQTARRSVKQ